MLTPELMAKALPANLKNAATQQLADMVNTISQDEFVAEQIRNNFISYTGVLKDGKYKAEDYVKAVAFVSHKLMGDSNQEAYFKAFPERYQKLMADGRSAKDIAAYVSAYARGKLVNAIMEQSLVPTWVLNQDLHQKAINVQAMIMQDPDVSPKVRVEAANSLLTHLQKPKETGPLLNIDMREQSGVNELRDLLGQLAGKQVEAIREGQNIREITRSRIFDMEKGETDAG